MSDIRSADRPSEHGKLLGSALALIAERGRQDLPAEIPEPCLTCAFREGTLPNLSAGTGKMALDCVLGIDRDRFACHHGMKDGSPSKICLGYITARLAPFSFTKEVIAVLHMELGKIDDQDKVRADFDRWLDTVSDDDKTDIYRLSRKFALLDAASRSGEG